MSNQQDSRSRTTVLLFSHDLPRLRIPDRVPLSRARVSGYSGVGGIQCKCVGYDMVLLEDLFCRSGGKGMGQ